MVALLQIIFAAISLVVFVVSAVVALVQLRHARLNYQMNTASTVLQFYSTPQFQEWLHFITFDLEDRLEEPDFRNELLLPPVNRHRHPEIYVCEYYTMVGSCIKNGLMPTEMFMENGSWDASIAWKRLRTPIELLRETRGPRLYAGFEYLALLCDEWLRHQPGGSTLRTPPKNY